MKRGAFILLEGIDHSGKTTQCQRLVNALNSEGRRAKLYTFPNRSTIIGQQINSYLQNKSELDDHCIHLLFTANRWESRLADSIIEDLNSGITIICDRYFASGVVFSVAKGMNMDWCLSPERGLPAPDKIFLLDLSPEEQKRRKGFGEERYENSAFQNTVRDSYYNLMNQMPQLDWEVINAEGTRDDVFKKLYDKIDNIIECCDKPISTLSLVCEILF